jgi:hypothetical protein
LLRLLIHIYLLSPMAFLVPYIDDNS